MLDAIIIIVLAASAIMGFRKGFIGQTGSVAAIITGIIACRMLGAQAVEMIMPADAEGVEQGFMTQCGITILVYAAIYIAAYYAVILMTRMLKLVTHTLLLGPLDRIAGALVSVVKWFMAVSVALNLFLIFSPSTDIAGKSNIGNGKPVRWIIELAPAAWGALTQNMINHGS